MGGDYSRKSFDTLRNYAGVFMQQGHVTLDADWNELVAILERRLRAETVDIIGRAVVPLETPTGFEIRASGGGGGNTLEIGRGRMYVHGLLAQNHGLIDDVNPPIFDRTRQTNGHEDGVLDEPTAREPGDFVPYEAQPWLPAAPDVPENEGLHLVYLDVWQRKLTPLKAPELLEPALGGIDSTTRWQTVWQVRVLADVGEGVTCATPDADMPEWLETIAPSAGRLSNGTIEFEDSDDPCLIPPGGGYRGLENQLYRVEIHTGGDLSEARFKWSRENASVAASVETIEAVDRITVRRIGRDSVLRFNTGDWVEVTDDIRELNGEPGQMMRATVDEDTRTLQLSGPLAADLVPSNVDGDTLAARHTRVIRWDQREQVFLADGTPWENLNQPTSDGLIPVPPAGQQVHLESGVVVSFSLEPGDGAFRAQDYWCFAARTAGAQIEPLENAPPTGIHHHYARLAVVTFPDTVDDCRVFWPPPFGGESCGCTVCITPEGHANGELTIQDGIDQLPALGGTVCLASGVYVLDETPIVIGDRRAVRLRGQSTGTVLFYAGGGGAIRITDSIDVTVEDLAIVTIPGGEGPNGALAPPSAGIHLRNAMIAAVRRVTALVFAGELREDRGVALDGVQIELAIQDCLVAAPIAIGDLSDLEDQDEDRPGYLLLAEIDVGGNFLIGGDRAIALEGLTLHASPLRIIDNLIFAGGRGGVLCTGFGLPAAAVAVQRNAISVTEAGDGIVIGVANSRLQDNEIVGTGRSAGSGIVFREGQLPDDHLDSQIVGNRIQALGSAGLVIEDPVGSLLIKRNVIRECGMAAIAMGPDAAAEYMAVDNNVIEDTARARNAEGQPIAAVSLARVGEAQLHGNRIDGVARNSTASVYWAGISLRGVGLLRLRSNSLRNVGPEQGASPAVAVFIQGPFFMVDVNGNQINGTAEPVDNDNSSWIGLAIMGAASPAVRADALLPAFFAAGDTLFALSEFGLRAMGRLRERQVTAQGNEMLDAHGGNLPMVLVDIDDAAGSCVFLGNQCRLLQSGSAGEVVRISARVVAASNNVVRRTSDLDAMRLVVGQNGRATVLGNLTFGNIRIEPGGVPPEFQALNLLAP